MPKSLTSGNLARGQFDKHDFLYVAQDDEYPCPAGERAIWRYLTVEEMMRIRRRTAEHPIGTLKHGMGGRSRQNSVSKKTLCETSRRIVVHTRVKNKLGDFGWQHDEPQL